MLSNINFDLHHGDFIGIVGPSGAGKSTIVSLIVKYYDINSGEINVDGISIAELNDQDLRQKLLMFLGHFF